MQVEGGMGRGRMRVGRGVGEGEGEGVPIAILATKIYLSEIEMCTLHRMIDIS